MKKLYWRPAQISRAVLLLVTAVALAGILAVERIRTRTRQPYHADKLTAAKLAYTAMQAVKAERLRLKLPIDYQMDPMASGLMGLPMSSVTSHAGVLVAKHTSINPNFAAVVVHMLRRARVRRGQLVAVGVSGSFPAINVSVYAAIRQLGLRPVIIASASGSQFGANVPGFLWLDMEAALHRRGVFPFRSVAASLGGIQDRVMGMITEGRQHIEGSIRKHGLQFIQPRDLQDSIDLRMAAYKDHAGGEEYAAYINVGGGSASVGTTLGKNLFKPGLNRMSPRGLGSLDAVMSRFIKDGVPVIHLVKIEQLAQRYGLPLRPRSLPRPGDGQIFIREEYSPWLTGGMLLIILGSLYIFFRTDLGSRLLRVDRRKKNGSSQPQQMV